LLNTVIFAHGAAVKALTAAQLAMAGEGQHTVSLDDAIEACRTTAMDMHMHCECGRARSNRLAVLQFNGDVGLTTADKETSLAGLAVGCPSLSKVYANSITDDRQDPAV
jgi:hypothetical protein